MGREALLMIINRRRRRFMASCSPFRNTLKMEVSAVLLLSTMMWKDLQRHGQRAVSGFPKTNENIFLQRILYKEYFYSYR